MAAAEKVPDKKEEVSNRNIPKANSPLGLRVLASCLRSTSSTLQYLTLRDCYFSAEELKKALQAAVQCRQLKYLKMCIFRLETEDIDLLLLTLPWLEGLWLNIEDIPRPRLSVS